MRRRNHAAGSKQMQAAAVRGYAGVMIAKGSCGLFAGQLMARCTLLCEVAQEKIFNSQHYTP
jgi:hypothetical protein